MASATAHRPAADRPGLPSPRRLLAVCAVDHPGGAETGLLRLLAVLSQQGGWRATLTTPGSGVLREAALRRWPPAGARWRSAVWPAPGRARACLLAADPAAGPRRRRGVPQRRRVRPAAAGAGPISGAEGAPRPRSGAAGAALLAAGRRRAGRLGGRRLSPRRPASSRRPLPRRSRSPAGGRALAGRAGAGRRLRRAHRAAQGRRRSRGRRAGDPRGGARGRGWW